MSEPFPEPGPEARSSAAPSAGAAAPASRGPLFQGAALLAALAVLGGAALRGPRRFAAPAPAEPPRAVASPGAPPDALVPFSPPRLKSCDCLATELEDPGAAAGETWEAPASWRQNPQFPPRAGAGALQFRGQIAFAEGSGSRVPAEAGLPLACPPDKQEAPPR